MAQDNDLTFMGLPIEVRVHILGEVIGPRVIWYNVRPDPRRPPAIEPSAADDDPSPITQREDQAGIIGRIPIMLVNRQIRREARHALWLTPMLVLPGEEFEKLASEPHDSEPYWSPFGLLQKRNPTENMKIELGSFDISLIANRVQTYHDVFTGFRELVRDVPHLRTLTIIFKDCPWLSEELCHKFGEDLLNLCSRFKWLVKQGRGDKWRSTLFRLGKADYRTGEGEVTIIRGKDGMLKQIDEHLNMADWVGSQHGPHSWFTGHSF